MINRIIYSIFTVFFMLKGINAQTVGFVPVSTNYYEAFPENTSGTFDIAISGTGGGAFTATFYIKADYSSDISTAKRSNTGTTNGYGQGYWKDFSTSLNWSSSDYTVNDENVSNIFSSEKVSKKVQEANYILETYKIDSVPAIIINDKYKISGRMAKSYERMIKISKHIIDLERQKRAN